ncbi:MAG: L-threonylcarbamoyladenylate synthase [Chloroflexota bacterium]
MIDTSLTSQPKRVIWPDNPGIQREIIQESVEILRAGGLIVIPTDTVYGIAADPLNEEAIERIFLVKQRPAEKRIALLIADPSDLDQLSSPVPAGALSLAQAAWPGALTIVLSSARSELGPTVALRVPNHILPRLICQELGSPLATTSANISSAPSPTTPMEVTSQLPKGYGLLIDDGKTAGGVDSTVIDFTLTPPRLLRRGGLERSIIATALGEDATARLLQSG